MPSIRLKTSVPGPRSRDLMQRRDDALPRGVYSGIPIFVAHAEGVEVEDVDGNRFIDFAGGIGTSNVGHRAGAVVEAVRNQAGRFLHTAFSVAPYEGYVRVAERLNTLTPGDFRKKTLLVNSGAEAVENAVKVARCYTRRPAVICFEDAFHGRTLLTMSMTSKTNPYKTGFGPFAPEVYRIPFGYCYRCSYSLRYPSCQVHCARHLEDTFKRVVEADAVAAVVAEPILGEGGFVVPPHEFFGILQDICRRHGILFIADEVQTGFGRTGRLFACEHYGIVPDLLVTAKSLGGGLPLAAITGRSEIMDAPVVGGVGGTFGGNPLACEAALAVLDIFEQSDLCARANHIGQRLTARARRWQEQWPLIGEVRGIGAMQAVELVRSPETKEPAAEETKQIVRYAYEHGLILFSAGTYENVVRFLVPLVVTDEQLDEGLDVLEAAIETVAAGADALRAHVHAAPTS
jgi:4-aminobutyrate aminotransferase/(S)-3-amino-2-methylpropionate transaminase